MVADEICEVQQRLTAGEIARCLLGEDSFHDLIPAAKPFALDGRIVQIVGGPPGRPGLKLFRRSRRRHSHRPLIIRYSTVTLLARFRGLSTLQPLASAAW